MTSSTAVFSPDGAYRYGLTRRWAPGLTVTWVMLNPSTADAEKDDPTVRRCIGFAKAWGYGGIEVVNLFALRATNPRRLFANGDPVGPDNDAAILAAARRGAHTIAAWGTVGAYLGRDRHVYDLFHSDPVVPPDLLCVGRTAAGHPRHPLYVAASTPFERWEPPA